MTPRICLLVIPTALLLGLLPSAVSAQTLPAAKKPAAKKPAAKKAAAKKPAAKKPAAKKPAAKKPMPTRPSFLSLKPEVPKLLLEKKKEGWYIVPMPIIYYDDDRGLGLGAFGEIYDNGDRSDPFFRFVPYGKKIFFSGEWATRDFWAYRLRYEQNFIAGSRFRFQADGDVERYGRANYFGVGADAMRKLTNPRDGQQFDSYADYHNSLTLIENGQTLARYNHYGETRVRLLSSAKVELYGGMFQLVVGFQFAHYSIDDRTGTQQEGRDAAGNRIFAPHGTTKLAADCAANRIKGCNGGFDNLLKIGIIIDSRDFEPNPEIGLLFQSVAELSPRFLGSEETYLRINTSVAGYYSLLPKLTRLVAAGRFIYQMSFGDVPFFAQDSYAFADKDRFGFGGFDTMRGYQLNRFIGRVATLFNFELRWRFLQWILFGQQWSLGFTPFFEIGRVFDSVSELSFRDWRWSYGGGIRLALNLSTVISFDFGVSRENEAFFMSMGHQF